MSSRLVSKNPPPGRTRSVDAHTGTHGDGAANTGGITGQHQTAQDRTADLPSGGEHTITDTGRSESTLTADYTLQAESGWRRWLARQNVRTTE